MNKGKGLVSRFFKSQPTGSKGKSGLMGSLSSAMAANATKTPKVKGAGIAKRRK